ncbi:MAG: hypothetical protein V4654_12620 [Bdellovibrionota bacterium]
MSKVLFLEINEVPYRLIDQYINHKDFSNIKKLFQNSWTFTSIAVDDGELSPWITWPTVHRGMDSSQHGVKNLGQDVKTFQGSTIWEDLRKQGYSVGVFGALQSWPPKDPGSHGFYIPDTFAHDEQCIPTYVEPLQKFNLGQVRSNGKTVKSNIPPVKDVINFLLQSFRCGIRLSTIFKIVEQVISERFNSELKARRPIFQTIIFWDVYMSLLKKSNGKLKYSSFFTNHVASAMHRYWHHIFPQDFGKSEKGLHESTILYSLKTLDNMLADVFSLADKNDDLVLVFGSSMGQDAVHNPDHHGKQLAVDSVDKLLLSMNILPNSYQKLLAMVPQVAISVEDGKLLKEIEQLISNFGYQSGVKSFSTDMVGKTLSITIKTPSHSDVEDAKLYLGNKSFSFEECGVKIHAAEALSGYHIPEGILAFYNANLSKQNKAQKRKSINADKIKSVLTKLVETDDVRQLKHVLSEI